jgi:hypothetical protein
MLQLRPVQQTSTMCQSPDCTKIATYIVTNPPGRAADGPPIAAYCEAHATEAAQRDSGRKNAAASSGVHSGQSHCA